MPRRGRGQVPQASGRNLSGPAVVIQIVSRGCRWRHRAPGPNVSTVSDMPSQSRPFTFDRVVRILAALLLAAAAVWLINTLRNVLLPFFLACLIAYLLEPLVGLNQRLLRLKGRVVASLLTIVEVTAVLVLLGYFFVPSVIREVAELEAMLSRGDGAAPSFIPPSIAGPLNQWVKDLNVGELMRSSHFMSLVNSGGSFIAAAVSWLLHTLEWLLTFIYVIFILIDYPTLTQGFKQLVPVRYRRTVFGIASDIAQSMNRYFRGQALLALCAAVLYCIGFSIVGIPMAIVLGILVGVLYMIPYFQYITLIPVAAVCLIDSMGGGAGFWTELGQCLLVYVVSQCVCDYILTPKIMGKAMGLNPAIILLSLSVWGTLMGIIGMIIALPLTTLLLSYYRRYFIDRNATPPEDPPAAL